ncbi:MAG: SDR family oxidoreductase [Reyranella sp.]|uniref:SDR family oxidoreductase n=1 Tax=Reyranella sp. TaxID=1929291 RepID=UPI003D0A283E
MTYRSVFKPGLFEGQTIIVTGGGSGIGRCTAHEIAALGAHVVISGRKPDKLATVKGEIEASGGSCEMHAFDIREEAQVREAIAAIVARNGRIHGLFNNAGGQFPAPAAAMSAKGFDVVVRNNLTGGFIVSREVYTQSMQQHGGSIVNMAADMRNGFPSMAHTGAARAGMVNLTMTLAYEWAQSGVRVNAVSPGWIASSGMDTYQGEFKENIPKLKNHCPLGRLGTESEVSSVVCFLLSEASAYITGTEIRIDGGVPLGNRSMDLPQTDRSQPFNGFHLARTPKVLGG